MINGIGIVGFRDPNGIRPLVFGTREKTKVEGATKDYVVSSESVVMDMLGFELSREILIAAFLLQSCLSFFSSSITVKAKLLSGHAIQQYSSRTGLAQRETCRLV